MQHAAAAAAAAAADAEWNPQENGKPSSTEYIEIRSLHHRDEPEKKKKLDNSKIQANKTNKITRMKSDTEIERCNW